MKIFIDSANFEEIKEAVSWGIIDGATTNPSLMAKEKGQSVKILAGQDHSPWEYDLCQEVYKEELGILKSSFEEKCA